MAAQEGRRTRFPSKEHFSPEKEKDGCDTTLERDFRTQQRLCVMGLWEKLKSNNKKTRGEYCESGHTIGRESGKKDQWLSAASRAPQDEESRPVSRRRTVEEDGKKR